MFAIHVSFNTKLLINLVLANISISKQNIKNLEHPFADIGK